MPMLHALVSGLLATGLLHAAATLDIDVAALRALPDTPRLRALVEPAMPAAARDRLAEISAAIGTDPRQTLGRIVISVGDDRLPVAVLTGIPTVRIPVAIGLEAVAVTLADGRQATALPRHDGAALLVLDGSTMALGPVEVLDHARIPAPRTATAPIHLAVDLPADSPRPAARWVSAVTADGDGSGHLRAVITARSETAAMLVAAVADRMRTAPPSQAGEAGRAALAAATIARDGRTVTISADLPLEVRAALLRRLIGLAGGAAG